MFKLIEFFTKTISWLQIVASPLLFGLGIGTLVYYSNPNETRLLVGISIAVLGLLVGIIWATYIWRTRGTITFMSKIKSTSELDQIEENDIDIK